MGYALLFPEPTTAAQRGAMKGKKLSGQSESLGVSVGHWQNLVSNARALLRETTVPPLPAASRWRDRGGRYDGGPRGSTGFLRAPESD